MAPDLTDPLPRTDEHPPSDEDVAAAWGRVQQRLDRRRRTYLAAGSTVVVALALSGAALLVSRGSDPAEEERVAGGDTPPSSQPAPSDLPDGARLIQGIECGYVPAEASTSGLDMTIGDGLTFPAPKDPAGRPRTSVTVRNRGEAGVTLSGPGEISVLLIDPEGAIASLPEPSLVAGTIPVGPGVTTDIPAGLPLNSCDQSDDDRLAPGTYQVAAVALVRVDGGEVAVVRGDLAVVTYG